MKLVRDKMPQIAEANGRPMTTRRADPEEMLRLLKAKLIEEAAELAATRDGSAEELEEICDVLTVIDRLVSLVDPEALTSVILSKHAHKGPITDTVWVEEADQQCKAV